MCDAPQVHVELRALRVQCSREPVAPHAEGGSFRMPSQATRTHHPREARAGTAVPDLVECTSTPQALYRLWVADNNARQELRRMAVHSFRAVCLLAKGGGLVHDQADARRLKHGHPEPESRTRSHPPFALNQSVYVEAFDGRFKEAGSFLL
jgi:hypothetical protein